MRKPVITGLLVFVICSTFGLIGLADYKPLISGNYQQGERWFTLEEGSGDDYYFRQAWLKYKQKLSPKSYYYFRVRFYENDYQNKDQYDSLTYDFSTNFTYQILQSLRVKTDLRLRNKAYRLAEEKDYHELASDLTLTFKSDPNRFSCTLGVQREFYPLSDRDNLAGKVGLRWERELNKGLSIYTQLKFNGQIYYVPGTLADRFRQAISLGFDYQL